VGPGAGRRDRPLRSARPGDDPGVGVVLHPQRRDVVRLQRETLILDPQAALDLGRPPAHLQAIVNPKRRAAFIQGWQALRLGEQLYAAIRTRKPNLVFQAQSLFAFVLASLQATMRIPRLLWPVAPARPP
jgi:hypothetical protein